MTDSHNIRMVVPFGQNVAVKEAECSEFSWPKSEAFTVDRALWIQWKCLASHHSLALCGIAELFSGEHLRYCIKIQRYIKILVYTRTSTYSRWWVDVSWQVKHTHANINHEGNDKLVPAIKGTWKCQWNSQLLLNHRINEAHKLIIISFPLVFHTSSFSILSPATSENCCSLCSLGMPSGCRSTLLWLSEGQQWQRQLKGADRCQRVRDWWAMV